MVMGLVSGLPHLKGLVPKNTGAVAYKPWHYEDATTNGAAAGPYNIAAWGDDNKFLFPDAWNQGSTDPKPNDPIPDYFALDPANPNSNQENL